MEEGNNSQKYSNQTNFLGLQSRAVLTINYEVEVLIW